MRIPLTIETRQGAIDREPVLFEKAGAREQIYFDPAHTKAAIVTCGGLCPGLNNVIRSIFFQLYHQYGVQQVLGFRYGYHGLDPKNGHAPMLLTADLVSDIHRHGGSLLGTSRGHVPATVMVEYLRSLDVHLLFPVGGDGTQRGALAVAQAAQEMGYPLAVVGVPKTIDNDILYVWRTFGYMTALEEARSVIESAHNEARAVINGVGLVRLMGRESGFIAAGAALASQEVNYALIPEQRFTLDGPGGLLDLLERRLAAKRHAVIVVAEGAGQDLIPQELIEKDASGNVKFADIGVFLKARIEQHFRTRGIPLNIRYIDPSYTIRSRPANTDDSLLCDQLARAAVHAAMAGKTDLIIGHWHDQCIHVPMSLATVGRKKLAPSSSLWTAVLAATGQPARIGAW
jgi:6-phosphofructokinase 1